MNQRTRRGNMNLRTCGVQYEVPEQGNADAMQCNPSRNAATQRRAKPRRRTAQDGAMRCDSGRERWNRIGEIGWGRRSNPRPRSWSRTKARQGRQSRLQAQVDQGDQTTGQRRTIDNGWLVWLGWWLLWCAGGRVGEAALGTGCLCSDCDRVLKIKRFLLRVCRC